MTVIRSIDSILENMDVKHSSLISDIEQSWRDKKAAYMKKNGGIDPEEQYRRSQEAGVASIFGQCVGYEIIPKPLLRLLDRSKREYNRFIRYMMKN